MHIKHETPCVAGLVSNENPVQNHTWFTQISAGRTVKHPSSYHYFKLAIITFFTLLWCLFAVCCGYEEKCHSCRHYKMVKFQKNACAHHVTFLANEGPHTNYNIRHCKLCTRHHIQCLHISHTCKRCLLTLGLVHRAKWTVTCKQKFDTIAGF